METITSEQPTVPAAAAQAEPSMSEPVVPRRSPLRATIKTGRPQEWIKNVVEAQVDIAREVTSSYTAAARTLLK